MEQALDLGILLSIEAMRATPELRPQARDEALTVLADVDRIARPIQALDSTPDRSAAFCLSSTASVS